VKCSGMGPVGKGSSFAAKVREKFPPDASFARFKRLYWVTIVKTEATGISITGFMRKLSLEN